MFPAFNMNYLVTVYIPYDVAFLSSKRKYLFVVLHALIHYHLGTAIQNMAHTEYL